MGDSDGTGVAQRGTARRGTRRRRTRETTAQAAGAEDELPATFATRRRRGLDTNIGGRSTEDESAQAVADLKTSTDAQAAEWTRKLDAEEVVIELPEHHTFAAQNRADAEAEVGPLDARTFAAITGVPAVMQYPDGFGSVGQEASDLSFLQGLGSGSEQPLDVWREVHGTDEIIAPPLTRAEASAKVLGKVSPPTGVTLRAAIRALGRTNVAGMAAAGFHIGDVPKSTTLTSAEVTTAIIYVGPGFAGIFDTRGRLLRAGATGKVGHSAYVTAAPKQTGVLYGARVRQAEERFSIHRYAQLDATPLVAKKGRLGVQFELRFDERFDLKPWVLQLKGLCVIVSPSYWNRRGLWRWITDGPGRLWDAIKRCVQADYLADALGEAIEQQSWWDIAYSAFLMLVKKLVPLPLPGEIEGLRSQGIALGMATWGDANESADTDVAARLLAPEIASQIVSGAIGKGLGRTARAVGGVAAAKSAADTATKASKPAGDADTGAKKATKASGASAVKADSPSGADTSRVAPKRREPTPEPPVRRDRRTTPDPPPGRRPAAKREADHTERRAVANLDQGRTQVVGQAQPARAKAAASGGRAETRASARPPSGPARGARHATKNRAAGTATTRATVAGGRARNTSGSKATSAPQKKRSKRATSGKKARPRMTFAKFKQRIGEKTRYPELVDKIRPLADRYRNAKDAEERRRIVHQAKGYVLESTIRQTHAHKRAMHRARQEAESFGVDPKSVRFTTDVKDGIVRSDGTRFDAELTDGVIVGTRTDPATGRSETVAMAIYEAKSAGSVRKLVIEHGQPGQFERSRARMETGDVRIDGTWIPEPDLKVPADFQGRTQLVGIVPAGLTDRKKANLTNHLTQGSETNITRNQQRDFALGESFATDRQMFRWAERIIKEELAATE